MRGSISDCKRMNQDVRAKLENRRHVTNQFKLDRFVHLYRPAFTDREWAAMGVLKMNTALWDRINTTQEVKIDNFPKPLFEDCPVYSFGTSFESDKMLRQTTNWHSLPEAVQVYLVHWIHKDYLLKHQAETVAQHVKKCAELCNTWGQLARLWPTIVGLFPKERQNKFLNQKAKSKLPDAAYRRHPDTGVRELLHWFHEERIIESDEILAASMLLPKPPDEYYHPTVHFRD